MFWFTHLHLASLAVIIVVIVIVAYVLLLAISQHAKRITRVFELALLTIDRYAQILNKFKDRRLEPWVDKIPIPADVMTALRLLGIGISLWMFHQKQFHQAIWWFIIGWLFDFLDGLKARAKAKRCGHPTRYGKYLDPIVDWLCMIGIAILLGPSYPAWLIDLFGACLVARGVLFTIIMIGRRFSSWKSRLPSDILPETMAGRFKTVFVALSAGLVIMRAAAPTDLAWPWALLGIATGLEIISLIQQSRRVRCQLSTPKLVVLDNKIAP